MKKQKRLIAMLTAVMLIVANLGVITFAGESYEAGKVYDATEAYVKKQPSSYSYNGYKMVPFATCDDFLSGIGIGTGSALASSRTIAKGDKLVIEFKTPIDSSKFETITISMKQVPGNSYNAYNASDDILSTVRKSFSFSTYGIEKVSFLTSLFANKDGMVEAIILQNTDASEAGQLFVDEFFVSEKSYELNVVYDANQENVKTQSTTTYKGVTVVPFSEIGDFWSKDANASNESGYALVGSRAEGKALLKGDVLVLEFVRDIKAKDFPYITLTFATSTVNGSSLDFYNTSEIQNGVLGKAKVSGDVAFWEFRTVTLKTSDFKDANGYVSSIAMKVTGDEAATFAIGQFTLTKTAPVSEGTGSDILVDGTDKNNQYDATAANFVVQGSNTYKGLTINPLSTCSDYLAKEVGIGDGYSIASQDFVKEGDVIAIQFKNPIDSKKADLITMAIKHTPGYVFEAYMLSDTSMTKAIKSFSTGTYELEKVAFRTSLFAESDGKVAGILLKCVTAGESGQFFIDGYNLDMDPYKLGVTYDVDENYVKLQSSDTYNGLTVVPFTERSLFWSKEAKVESDAGYGVMPHKADGSDIVNGDVMILEFVTDISADKFEVLNLTLATSLQEGATFEVYNVNEIKDGKLGPVRQRVSADFWDFKLNNLALASLADENGYVSGIALKLVTDKVETFTVGSFSLATLDSLVEKNSPDILDNKISVTETDDAYDFYIEFNKTGSKSSSANEDSMGDMVSINGVKVSDINKKEKHVTVEWLQMGRYNLKVSVDKDYEGEGAVINKDKLLVGNCITLAKGLLLPNGEKLSDTFGLHIYVTDNITDVQDGKDYQPIELNGIRSQMDQNDNLMITLSFNNQVTGDHLYYANNPESFNSKELSKLNGEVIYYDPDLSKAFIYGGYKSSLLDNLKINGNSIAEWLAMDQISGSPAYNTAIMIHYGMEGGKTATIFVGKESNIFKEILKSHDDETMRITLEEGLKFTTGKALGSSATYGYEDGVWTKLAVGDFSVYYDGQKVEDGAKLEVNNVVSANNIEIYGEGNYRIDEAADGNTATYTIYDGDEKVMEFSVTGTEVVLVQPIETSTNIWMYVISVLAAVVVLGAAGITIYGVRRKKHAKIDK